jgi:hypothetical protein
MLRRAVQALLAVLVLASPSLGEALRVGAKLCVYPVRLPLEEEAGAERRDAIQAQLSAALKAASFELGDLESVTELRKRVFDEALRFDTATAELIPEAHERALDALERGLRELGCDAQLVPGVSIVRASFVGGTAAWDGTRQQVSSTGRIFLSALGGVMESGWVNAFSLRLYVADLRDRTIAMRSAGIETPLQLAVLKDQDLVPDDLWLKDSARIEAAIQSALGPGGSALRGAERKLATESPAP